MRPLLRRFLRRLVKGRELGATAEKGLETDGPHLVWEQAKTLSIKPNSRKQIPLVCTFRLRDGPLHISSPSCHSLLLLLLMLFVLRWRRLQSTRSGCSSHGNCSAIGCARGLVLESLLRPTAQSQVERREFAVRLVCVRRLPFGHYRRLRIDPGHWTTHCRKVLGLRGGLLVVLMLQHLQNGPDVGFH